MALRNLAKHFDMDIDGDGVLWPGALVLQLIFALPVFVLAQPPGSDPRR